MERFKFFAVTAIILIFAAVWQGCAEGDSDPAENSVTITWTATGDDGYSGTASGYIGYWDEDSAKIANNPMLGTPIVGLPAPLIAGTNQSHDIVGVPSQSVIWVVLQAYDDVGNKSPWSNIARKETGDAIPPAAINDLH